MKGQNKGLVWAVSIQNAVVMICFTVLAVLFHKWWIVLFSVLWIMSIKTETSKVSKEEA